MIYNFYYESKNSTARSGGVLHILVSYLILARLP